ncbi:MAG TPA: hypothetical protein VFK42_10750 [Acidimicrobiales bacterium]|nr:hypothetical protein [Acidimicrobiales bacterium]
MPRPGMALHSPGNAPVDVSDDRRRDELDEALDTAALLDQGEQLLAESARLLRRLDAALRNHDVDTSTSPVERGE